MKRLISIVSLLAISLIFTNVSYADDADEVRAAVLAREKAAREGDIDTMFKYVPEEWSVFWFSGSLLAKYDFDKDSSAFCPLPFASLFLNCVFDQSLNSLSHMGLCNSILS
jgi:hypothetical protein